MTVTEIHELNEKFQKGAVQLSELIPTGTLVQATSMLIRSARKIDNQFLKLLKAPSHSVFNQIMGQLEDETDEILFILDQLELANKKQKISLIDDFVKEGYDLMAIYSRCFDLIIGKKVKEEE
ncbi:hypothetical protein SAMN05421640_2892 [Ekhidna lutea]|uniref:Uncharacterized protein n=1 Tax=Ekhidna lutea TaxID=447679 RepID=A0A239L0I8_EKHLU|nr:hypothetical protein [Ekhidna lutea]SNT24097.1 hypothetical protein SAMN05421640_2892 [Ekhidna lutea]